MLKDQLIGEPSVEVGGGAPNPKFFLTPFPTILCNSVLKIIITTTTVRKVPEEILIDQNFGKVMSILVCHIFAYMYLHLEEPIITTTPKTP